MRCVFDVHKTNSNPKTNLSLKLKAQSAKLKRKV